MRAIVRYHQGLRYGFEFLTQNDYQRDTINRVCQYLATRADSSRIPSRQNKLAFDPKFVEDVCPCPAGIVTVARCRLLSSWFSSA